MDAERLLDQRFAPRGSGTRDDEWTVELGPRLRDLRSCRDNRLCHAVDGQVTLDLIFSISRSLGLPADVVPFDPLHMLFVNLMGSVVVVWSLVRLSDPTQTLGRFDALARARHSAVSRG